MGALKNKLIEDCILVEKIRDNKGMYYDIPTGCRYWETKNPTTGDIIILEYNYEPESEVETTEIFGYIPQWYAKEEGLA